MTNRSRKLQLVLTVVLGTVLFLSVAALASAGKGKPGKGHPEKGHSGKSPSASQYQYGPSGHQYGKHKVTICHKGKKSITVGAPAAKAHLRHGDKLGRC